MTWLHVPKMMHAAGPVFLEPRLVGGREDPDGMWAYGRLELFNGDFFSGFSEIQLTSEQQLGRAGVVVACRSLGFVTGAQLLAGEGSGLPGDDLLYDAVGVIDCSGEEDTLSDCGTATPAYDPYSSFVGENDGDNSVAIVCYNPSGRRF